MQDYKEQTKYEQAKKRVDDERGFYTHLTIYIIINIILLYINTSSKNPGFTNWLEWHLYITPVAWGIGLVGHGLKVFSPNLFLGKAWEERKIKEIMDNEMIDYL